MRLQASLHQGEVAHHRTARLAAVMAVAPLGVIRRVCTVKSTKRQELLEPIDCKTPIFNRVAQEPNRNRKPEPSEPFLGNENSAQSFFDRSLF